MKARLIKKLMSTPIDKIAPGWLMKIRNHDDHRINEALRLWRKKVERRQG